MWIQFDDKPWPELITRCIESQKLPGYEHKVITVEDCYPTCTYIESCVDKARKLYNKGDRTYTTWVVKASDLLRCIYIERYGGIYLDADMEVLPGKNFDDLLDNRFFTENEVFGCSANAGFGAEAKHPFLTEYIQRVLNNFQPEGEMVFEPGIRAFSDLMWITDKEKDGIKIYDSKMFFPYNHGTGAIDITPETRVYHHYANTWCKEDELNKLKTDYHLRRFF